MMTEFFQPFNNDENGFYSITTDYKKKEIFYITLTNPRLNRIYELSGKYSLKDTVVIYDEKNTIYLTDKVTGDTLDTGYPDRFTGQIQLYCCPRQIPPVVYRTEATTHNVLIQQS